MFGIIDPVTGFSPEEEKDFEEFISKLFNTDFSLENDKYLAIESTTKHSGHVKCFFRIKEDFYRIDNLILRKAFLIDEKDYDTLFLLPLNDKNIGDINEDNKIISLKNRTEQDMKNEWNKSINLTLEWTLFKGAKHPERIEEYKKNIQNKMTSLRREERKIQERINAEKQKLEMLSDLQTGMSQEEKTL